jgi:hypothetical protein
MKKIILLFLTMFAITSSFAQQKTATEKYTGLIGNQACVLQFSTYEKKSKAGYEDEITYRGTITIGTKKIVINGWYEGNTMRFTETIIGKKVNTIYFDLSSGHDEQYEMIGKRTMNSKVSIIKLNRVK